MAGDGPVRFCQHCRKNVYNLSEMPRDDAERLVCESAGSLCVRFYRSRGGEVLTLNYGRRDRSKRGWRFWTMVGTLGAIMASAANALVTRRTARSLPIRTMGVMCYPTTLPSTRPVTGPSQKDLSTDASDEARADPVTDPDAPLSLDQAETP